MLQEEEEEEELFFLSLIFVRGNLVATEKKSAISFSLQIGCKFEYENALLDSQSCWLAGCLTQIGIRNIFTRYIWHKSARFQAVILFLCAFACTD